MHNSRVMWRKAFLILPLLTWQIAMAQNIELKQDLLGKDFIDEKSEPSVPNPLITQVINESLPQDNPQAFQTQTAEEAQIKLDEHPSYSLSAYNIYAKLPRAKQALKILYPAFGKFNYGPYTVAESLYNQPYPGTDELTQRIIALKETITRLNPAFGSSLAQAKLETEKKEKADNAEKKDQEVVDKEKNKNKKEETQMILHLADLYAMKYERTREQKFIENASALYKQVYQALPAEVLDRASINISQVLLMAEEFSTAFPIIKRLSKNETSKLGHEINDVLIEFYFLSGRYAKADDVVALMTQNKELLHESKQFLKRVGDILFFLNRHQDAVEWYQTVLKAESNPSTAENVSWLYFAEALYQIKDFEASERIYQAMLPVFKNTPFVPVINFRLLKETASKQEFTKMAHDAKIANWMQIETLSQQFKENPRLFTAESFDIILQTKKLDADLMDHLLLLQGFALRNEKKYYHAIKNFHELEIKQKNLFIRNWINETIIETLVKGGFATTDAESAFTFLRTLMRLKFNLKAYSPEKIYALLYHNLALIGLENASAELTLRIIEQSVHRQKDQTYIQFKLAENMHDAFAYRQSIKTLQQVDLKLLDPSSREKFHEIMVENQFRTGQKLEALNALDEWEKSGTSANGLYWIANKKVEILYEFERYKEAMDLIDSTIGEGNLDTVPENFKAKVKPLIAYRTILYNKLGRNNECLLSFYKNQNIIFESQIRDEIIFAIVASAMSMKKTDDVDKILVLAKTHMDGTSYNWLEKWSKGEMWVDQINRYMDSSSMAVQKQGPINP